MNEFDEETARYISSLEAVGAKVARIQKRLEIDEITSQEAAEMLLEELVKTGEKIAERFPFMGNLLVGGFISLMALSGFQMAHLFKTNEIEPTDCLEGLIHRHKALIEQARKHLDSKPLED